MVQINFIFAFAATFVASVPVCAIPLARDTTAADVESVKTFLTAYQNMDYDALKAAATSEFHFHDQAFPLLKKGADSLSMFHWFISDKDNTKMKIDIGDITQSEDKSTITAHYTADYYFSPLPGSSNHVVNPITSIFTVVDGKVSNQEDTYDKGFSGWAEQALGPTLGPLLKDSSATLAFIQAAGAAKLTAFMIMNPA